MSALRVLLIEEDVWEAGRISAVLEEANHAVLPARGFDEASQALQVEKFDAVLVGSAAGADLADFTAKLRQSERKQRNPAHAAVLSFLRDGTGVPSGSEPYIDGYLPVEFEAATFSEAVRTLARKLAFSTDSQVSLSELPIFEQDEFEAQVAHDRELLVEIIDLFLTEAPEQLSEMRNALAAGDYHRLSRVAHSIKGSVASLHAPQARAHAQQLELAAKEQEDQVCRFSLAALEQDLDLLQSPLLALREASSK